MRQVSLLRLGLSLSLLSFCHLAFAIHSANHSENQSENQAQNQNELIIQTDKIYDPNVLSMDSIQTYAKRFDFDYTNPETIEPNKAKIAEIETFLKSKPDYSAMTATEKEAMGKMLYQLGTYYTYISHQPDLAITAMNQANSLLKSKHDLAWNYNQMAYAYDKKFAVSGDEKEKQKAVSYANKVIALYHNNCNKQVAFAYCVRGAIENNAKEYPKAETSIKQGLNMYEKLLGLKDDTYIITKQRLALTILQQSGREEEALDMLVDLQKHWNQNEVKNNPYAANNLLAIAQAEFKLGNNNDARDNAQKVVNAYMAMYGKESEQLIQPYQLLADTYKKLGDQKLGDDYQIKANELDKS